MMHATRFHLAFVTQNLIKNYERSLKMPNNVQSGKLYQI